MCGQDEECDWQSGLPDTPGEWLWLYQWGCGCVHHAGVAWVVSDDEAPDGMMELSPGLRFSWEGQCPYEGFKPEYVSAWRKIRIPGEDWLDNSVQTLRS